MAADAAAVAPSDLTISPACTADIPARPHPPTIPDDTAAPSTEGSSRYTTHGDNPAMAKHANPDTSVPNAAAPSEFACGAVVPALASSFTPTTNVTEIAGLARTNATATWTRRRPAPRITGDTDDDHTIGANAATRYSSDDRMNSTTVVTSNPTIPNSRASGPRNVVASPPARLSVAANPSRTCWASPRPACHTTSASTSAPRISRSITVTVTAEATIALGPSFNASTINSGRPANPAWIAETSINATVTARAIAARGRTSPVANHASVRRGVVAVSSTPHTHSINSSSPLANQV